MGGGQDHVNEQEYFIGSIRYFLLIKIGFFACPPPTAGSPHGQEEVDSLQPAEMKTEVD